MKEKHLEFNINLRSKINSHHLDQIKIKNSNSFNLSSLQNSKDHNTSISPFFPKLSKKEYNYTNLSSKKILFPEIHKTEIEKKIILSEHRKDKSSLVMEGIQKDKLVVGNKLNPEILKSKLKSSNQKGTSKKFTLKDLGKMDK